MSVVIAIWAASNTTWESQGNTFLDKKEQEDGQI